MKLDEVSVTNYRSISTKTTFSVSHLTTLIGPNNEGKSNLLRALGLGMEIIRRWSSIPSGNSSQEQVTGAERDLVTRPGPRGRTTHTNRTAPTDERYHSFEWAQDYPVEKQGNTSLKPTEIRLTFVLDGEETSEFKRQTGISTNGTLPISITLTKLTASLKIVKQGPGASRHRENATRIAKFISDRIDVISIPAVRTSDHAQEIVRSLIQLRAQEHRKFNSRYSELLNELSELRDEIAQEAAEKVLEASRTYLPSLRDVKLETRDFERSLLLSEIVIDDGIPTPLAAKGDGVKSLVTLAVTLAYSRQRSESRSFILAVDEPESHLHSDAIHQLQNLLQDLSTQEQVVLASHNAIFANRDDISSNVTVRENRARPAESIREIRSILGVRIHDNLQSAETVVLLEGETDEKILKELLSKQSSQSCEDLSTGRVALKNTRGTSKLEQAIRTEKTTVSRILIVLDDDEAGRRAADRAPSDFGVDSSSIFILKNPVRDISEIEDLIDPACYQTALEDHFGRKLELRGLQHRSKKWSEVIQDSLNRGGVPGDASDNLATCKRLVSDQVSAHPESALRAEAEETIANLHNFIWA